MDCPGTTNPRDGKFLEIVGRYNPQTDPSTIEIDEAKAKEWLGKDARLRASVVVAYEDPQASVAEIVMGPVYAGELVVGVAPFVV